MLASLLAIAAPASADGGLPRLMAPATACPGQSQAGLSAADREEAMLCMTNFARDASGLRPLRDAVPLDRSSERKSADIIRCDEFSHEACGHEFTYWFRRVGFFAEDPCWRAAENIAWGSGGLGTVRSIFSAWIHSPGHRDNILGPYRQIGIGVHSGDLGGYGGAQVWTQHFGAHC